MTRFEGRPAPMPSILKVGLRRWENHVMTRQLSPSCRVNAVVSQLTLRTLP